MSTKTGSLKINFITSINLNKIYTSFVVSHYTATQKVSNQLPKPQRNKTSGKRRWDRMTDRRKDSDKDYI